MALLIVVTDQYAKLSHKRFNIQLDYTDVSLLISNERKLNIDASLLLTN